MLYYYAILNIIWYIFVAINVEGVVFFNSNTIRHIILQYSQISWNPLSLNTIK